MASATIKPITATDIPPQAQQDPEDPVQLARTLRRIKRRLLLEQCGVALPHALQSRPKALHRSSSQDSADTTDSTFRVAMSKTIQNASRRTLGSSSELTPAAPCVE
mmetsp:Transcript_13925/g.39094  ORF Transcript_13925/g.39094 Transcript_13925/m.39094 type:complete len:106 (+) Transcript_13925:96-413(+)